MATLPTLTRTIDDDFVNTWYEIRPDVMDNVLAATPFWLALNEYGCLKTQVGGEYITRTIGYGTKSTQRYSKGLTLTSSEPKLDTMARWDWRFFLTDVVRSLVDDRKNAGKFKIKDYISRRITNARDCMVQDMETYAMQWGAYYPAPLQFNGLKDICAPSSADTNNAAGGASSDTYASGTSNGNIDRTNSWWRNQVKTGTAPASLNLVADMRTFWNTITANQESPNFILTDQTLYEYYEDEVSDKQQIVRSAFDKKAADLGFETLTFKGATITWTSKLAPTSPPSGSAMYFLNMNYIECVYDPSCWFDMTEWMFSANQLERVAYIVCMTTGLITDQPRRHGVMAYA